MKNLLFILISFISVNCLAGSGWSQIGTIDEVYNHGWTVLVKMSGNPVSYGDCPSTSYYAINTSNSTSFNILFSQILMAHASGKKTTLWIDGNTCIGQSDAYQKISSIKTR